MITESLSKGDDCVAEPSGRSCRLTRDQVEHWQWLLVYELGVLIKEILPVLFPLCFLVPRLTDLYCHSCAADSDLHTYITVYVLGWIAATCVNSACGRCPRVCVSQITFTRRCSSRLPAPAPYCYHIKGSGCGYIQTLERQWVLGMHDWCWVCNIRYHKV